MYDAALLKWRLKHLRQVRNFICGASQGHRELHRLLVDAPLLQQQRQFVPELMLLATRTMHDFVDHTSAGGAGGAAAGGRRAQAAGRGAV